MLCQNDNGNMSCFLPEENQGITFKVDHFSDSGILDDHMKKQFEETKAYGHSINELCENSLSNALWDYDKYVLAKRLMALGVPDVQEKVLQWAPQFADILKDDVIVRMLDDEDKLNIGNFYAFCH